MSDIYFDEKYGKLYDNDDQKCVKYVYRSESGKLSNMLLVKSERQLLIAPLMSYE